MALTPEWRRRIDQWRKVLPHFFLRKVAPVAMSAFVTREQLSPEEARKRGFKPMPAGTGWGAKWEYGWFKGEAVVPAEAAGRPLDLVLEPGGECLIWLDGRIMGSRKGIRLTDAAEAGRKYEFLLECYGGHGPTPVGCGPVPEGVVTVPEPPAEQRRVGESFIAVAEDDAYQLWIDVESLHGLRENIDPDSLRVQEIDAGLRDFTTIVDPEAPWDDVIASCRAARERLRPLLDCRNGSTAPAMFCFGHAHLDIAWLWPLAETERKVVRTLANQIRLAERYPEHKFLHSQAHLFWMVKRLYPDFYEEVKRAVASGTVIADGGMWVEADTNVAGGEALIRQFVRGKRFFKDEFGVESEMLWLPDVFGYSGAIPQIMRGCGVRYFSTAKIYWAYNGGEPFPLTTFVWEGIDGSEVKASLCHDYNSKTRPETLIERWRQRPQKDGFSTRIYPFGWGDGGGGPDRDHLEFLSRSRDLEGAPRARIATPIEYFIDQDERGWPADRYVGELYFQAHRGTYTSQARTKRGNRKAEIALREAEMWAASASALAGFACPAERLEDAWRDLLLCQFHDILPGSSIARVYEEAEKTLGGVVDAAGGIAAQAVSSLAGKGAGLTVFNSLSWERKALVELPASFGGAAGAPTQEIGGKRFAEVSVPSCGWTAVAPSKQAAAPREDGAFATADTLENEFLRARFDEYGQIVGLLDKESGRELAAGPLNQMRMFRDTTTNWDAWDLDMAYESVPVDLPEKALIEVAASGPLVAEISIERKIGRSTLRQTASLRRGSRRIDFRTVIDWRESHRLLKVAFPLALHANEALHEIQFGHIARPNHRSRQFDIDRFEVSNHRWTALAEANRGAAVLNDCKYGVNVLGDTIMLTLLKSAMTPDMNADKGRQEFTYSVFAWNGPLAESGLVREGYDLNVPVQTFEGSGSESGSLFGVDAPNVVIDTVKPAEDGSGDIVVRLYECYRAATRCALTTSLPVASVAETDMLESNGRELKAEGGRIALDMRPFEIKTVRLSFGR